MTKEKDPVVFHLKDGPVNLCAQDVADRYNEQRAYHELLRIYNCKHDWVNSNSAYCFKCGTEDSVHRFVETLIDEVDR